MILEHGIFDPGECGFYRLDLLQDVDAIAFFLDHAADPAHLSGDPVEPADGGVTFKFHWTTNLIL